MILFEHVQACPGIAALGIGHQHAVGFRLAAPYPSPQLMQLGKAKPLGVFDDHQSGVGYVHAYLDHRGGYENVNLSLPKGLHDAILFGILHLAVDKGHRQIGERGRNRLGKFHRRLQGRLGRCIHVLAKYQIRKLLGIIGNLYLLIGILLHGGTDDIYLMPRIRLLPDEGIQPCPIPLVHHKGIYHLPSGRHFIQTGHVNSAVGHQGQSAGDGRSTHHQYVGGFVFLCQCRALADTEAMLFILDHQAQTGKSNALIQEGVGTYHHRCPILTGQGFAHRTAAGTGDSSRKEHALDSQFSKEGGQFFIMLHRQNFRRCHKSRLITAPGGQIGGSGRHRGLARSHITDEDPVHSLAAVHIRGDLADGSHLRPGKSVGQFLREGG